MSESLSVSREMAAPAQRVWDMVSDVTRMGEWSPENEGGAWLGGATGPEPGVKFKSTNRHGKRTWKTVAKVVDADPGQRFSFRVSAMGLKVAEWSYSFEPTTAGCRVTETWTDQRSRMMAFLASKATGVHDRAAHNQAGMEQTLERLAAAAELGSTPS